MRIEVLGPVNVELDGRPLSVGGSQQRRLLGLLVVHRGHAVSTERIVDALWNGAAPDGAARSVRTYVSRLRNALPDVAIDRSSAGYTLELDNASVGLDADEFDRLLDRARLQPPDLALSTYTDALALWLSLIHISEPTRRH